MRRILAEPRPAINAPNEGRRKAHAALDEALDRADLHRTTGRVQITLDTYEGGIRTVKIGSEEIFKPKS